MLFFADYFGRMWKLDYGCGMIKIILCVLLNAFFNWFIMKMKIIGLSNLVSRGV